MAQATGQGLRAAQPSQQADVALFQGVPAWRVAKLRTIIVQARARGANLDDDGADLTHPSLTRAFARGRTTAVPRRFGRRVLPPAVEEILWRAVIDARVAGARPSAAHQVIVERCRAIGAHPPTLSTVVTRIGFHRCPPPVLARLGLEDPEPPAGDMLAIAQLLVARCHDAGAGRFEAPTIARTAAWSACHRGQLDKLIWPSAAFREHGSAIVWHLKPFEHWSYAAPPCRGDATTWTLAWSASSDQDNHSATALPMSVARTIPRLRVRDVDLQAAFVGYRGAVLAALAAPRRARAAGPR